MKEDNSKELAYKKWIITLSIVIPVVVALLFGIRLENVQPLKFLPPIYASINGLTAVILLIALWAIKNKKVQLHENLMKVCIALSLLFLVMYVAYHITSESTKFGGEGWIRGVYFVLLISHILLSIGVIPLVLISFVRAFSKQFDKHRTIAKITFPIWLYVAVSGVVVYFMIAPYYS